MKKKRNMHGSDLLSYTTSIMKYTMSNPIGTRMDVVTLKWHFDNDWEKFIRAWAIREPSLVESYYATPHMLRTLKLRGGYKYLPKRCIRYFRPTQVAIWDSATICDIADKLARFIESALEEDYRSFSTSAARIRGMGQYSTQHLLRTAFLVSGKRHPSPGFVVMGSGASKSKYEIFTRNGIANIAAFNALSYSIGYREAIDAGELAYAMCMLAA